MHLVCVCARLKLPLPPNIWFRALEKPDEMRGLGFLAQPSCLHPRFYLGQGKNLPTENHLIKNLLICTFTTADQRRLLFLFLQFWSNNPQFSWLLGSKSKQVHIRKIGSRQREIVNYDCWYHYIDEEKDAFLQIPGWYVLLGHLGSSISVFRRADLFVRLQSTEPAIPLPILTSQFHNWERYWKEW